jgi:hypothetical protein
MDKRTWKRMVQMWGKIAEEYSRRARRDMKFGGVCHTSESLVLYLKFKHAIGKGIKYNCYFCDYANRAQIADGYHYDSCDYCPGIEVDPGFSCHNYDYNYNQKPVEFLDKLCELYVLRWNEPIEVNGFRYEFEK